MYQIKAAAAQFRGKEKRGQDGEVRDDKPAGKSLLGGATVALTLRFRVR